MRELGCLNDKDSINLCKTIPGGHLPSPAFIAGEPMPAAIPHTGGMVSQRAETNVQLASHAARQQAREPQFRLLLALAGYQKVLMKMSFLLAVLKRMIAEQQCQGRRQVPTSNQALLCSGVAISKSLQPLRHRHSNHKDRGLATISSCRGSPKPIVRSWFRGPTCHMSAHQVSRTRSSIR